MPATLCPLQLTAKKHPDRPFIISSDGIITYSQADRWASAVAERVKHSPILEKGRVGVVMFPTPNHIVFLLGLWRSRLTVCLMSPYWPIEQTRERLKDIHVEYVFADPLLNFSGHQDMFGYPHAWRFEPDQLATIMFTSGSSAKPKAVLHSWHNHYFSAVGSNDYLPFGAEDRWFLGLPLFHVSGLSILFRALASGAAVVMEDYKNLETSIRDQGVTHVSLVSTQMYRLLQIPSAVEHMRKLKIILLGGSAMSDSLIRRCIEERLPIHVSYGLTEMSSQVATSVRIACIEDRARVSVLKYRQVQIRPDGEIVVRGETLFKGYVSGELLMEPFDRDGWFHTGDLGEWDSDGHLRVTGRKDNMFISAGENIHPEEIEAYLCAHPSIQQAVVVSMEDPEYGQRPVAFVQFLPGQSLSRQEMVDYLKPLVSSIKIPVKFLSWLDDPAFVAMKPNRRYFQMLVEEYHKKGTL